MNLDPKIKDPSITFICYNTDHITQIYDTMSVDCTHDTQSYWNSDYRHNILYVPFTVSLCLLTYLYYITTRVTQQVKTAW
jgi:hypothetical protein